MEARLLNLACNHCGASLDVPEGTRFLTCSYCSSKLQIEHSGGAWYTSVLDQIQKNTEAVANDLDTVKLQDELEILDREMDMTCERYLSRDAKGKLRDPVLSVLVGLTVFSASMFICNNELGSLALAFEISTIMMLVGGGIFWICVHEARTLSLLYYCIGYLIRRRRILKRSAKNLRARDSAGL
jgi:hypothetical protein